MITLLVGVVGLISAVFAWWISPSQVKARLQKELKRVQARIEEARYESDQALLYHHSDDLTRLHAELKQLHTLEARILQRLG